jgi:hypothetical protein
MAGCMFINCIGDEAKELLVCIRNKIHNSNPNKANKIPYTTNILIATCGLLMNIING